MKIYYLIFLSLLSFSAYAESLYRWTDEKGKTHYSDQLPPASAKSIQEKNLGGNYIDNEQLPYATQIAVKKYPVTFYTSASHCAEVCTKAKGLLVKRGIPFTEKDATDPTEAENLKKLIGGLEVPVLLVGEIKLRGFEEANWHSTLDAAGYPRTAVKPVKPNTKPSGPAT